MEHSTAKLPEGVEQLAASAECVVGSSDSKTTSPGLEMAEASSPAGPSNVDPAVAAGPSNVDPAVAGPSNEARPAEPRVQLHGLAASRDELLDGYDTPAEETADVALMAASEARTAASSCKEVLGASIEAIDKGKSKVEAALQRAEVEAEREAVLFFKSLAQKYVTAIGTLSVKANKVEAAAEAAEAAANQAEAAAQALVDAAALGVDEEDKRRRTLAAIWSVTTANRAAIVAYRMEFSTLKTAKRYWRAIAYAEDRKSAFNRRMLQRVSDPECPVTEQRTCLKVAGTVTFILGVLVLVAHKYIDFRKSEHSGSILTLGIMLTGIPVMYVLFDVCRCYRRRRRQARENKALRMVAEIDSRLKELSGYFTNNGIPFSQEESDDE